MQASYLSTGYSDLDLMLWKMKEETKKIFAQIKNNRLLSWLVGSIAWTILLIIAVAIKGVIKPMTLYDAFMNFNLLYFFLAISIACTIYFGTRIIMDLRGASKVHFFEFEKITQLFEAIFNTNKNPLAKIFNELYAETPKLLSYNNQLKHYISKSYNNYIKRLEKFNGTKECFKLLVNEFETVFFAYEALFVKPIEKRKDEIAKDTSLKSKFNKFADEYENMRMQYKDYGEKMNALIPNIIRMDFDEVVTL